MGCHVPKVKVMWNVCIAALACGIVSTGAASQSASEQLALDAALHGTNAVALVLDARDGRVIALEHAEETGRLARAPGSVLKPFFLAAALRQGKVSAQTTVACHGNLRIAGRDVACTHPRSQDIFDAEQALAYSCNEWFAQIALRFTPQQAVALLRDYGFGSRTGLVAEEVAGTVREPGNAAQRQLLVLGLDDVEVTPAQLAQAYFRLAKQFDHVPVVKRGLAESVAYGMAHNAATPGVTIAGKTGTASDAGEAWTHGWFAGIAERGAQPVVAVVYVPRGNGADAALMAHRFFVNWDRAEAQ